MSVKRYELRDGIEYPWYAEMCEVDNGDYVLYSDYSSLRAELAALKDAARPVVTRHKGEGVLVRSDLDALAALVGEE